SARPPVATFQSRPVCIAELTDPPRNCSAARRISAAVFDVLYEHAQFGQDLTSPWIVQKDSWRGDGEGRQQRSQSAVGNRRSSNRTRYLRKSHTLDRGSEECRVVVRDQRSRDDRLHRLVAVNKGPGRNRSV